MLAAEFVTPDGGPNAPEVARVIKARQDEKVLLLSCGTWDQANRVVPPLVVDEAQIATLLDVFRGAVASIQGLGLDQADSPRLPKLI